MTGTEIHKSEKMQQVAEKNGWETAMNIDIPESEGMPNYSDICWTLYCKKEDETLKVVWYGNRQDYSKYKCGDFVSEPPHKAAVMAILNGNGPDQFSKIKAKLEVDPARLLSSRKLPWDDESPAIDILKSVANKRIRWIRTIDNELCEAMVTVDFHSPGSLEHFRVFEVKSGRALEWSDRYGFHAVSLNQIVSVG